MSDDDFDASPWTKLTPEQLEGADYALRVLHSSPVFKGRALEIIKEQQAMVVSEHWKKLRPHV